jgi:hypothetical protein
MDFQLIVSLINGPTRLIRKPSAAWRKIICPIHLPSEVGKKLTPKRRGRGVRAEGIVIAHTKRKIPLFFFFYQPPSEQGGKLGELGGCLVAG